MLYWIIGIIVAAVFLTVIRAYWELTHFECVEYKINSDKIKGRDQKIAMIADLHSNEFGDGNEHLIKAVRGGKPDAVVVAGDMIVGKKNENGKKTLSFFDKIHKDFTIYYGNGNHESRMKEDTDYYGDTYAKYEQILDSYHVHILDNKSVCYKNNSNICVYGLEIDRDYFRKGKKIHMSTDYLNSLLGKPDPCEFNILIAHNPRYFKEYARWGADLVLSGHNHGGIVGTPFKRGLISTQFTLFEKYYKGVFEEGNSRMIVSTGLGTHTIPFRLFNKQQLIFITISKE